MRLSLREMKALFRFFEKAGFVLGTIWGPQLLAPSWAQGQPQKGKKNPKNPFFFVNLVWDRFGLGQIWFGTSLVWDKFGLGQVWFGTGLVWDRFGLGQVLFFWSFWKISAGDQGILLGGALQPLDQRLRLRLPRPRLQALPWRQDTRLQLRSDTAERNRHLQRPGQPRDPGPEGHRSCLHDASLAAAAATHPSWSLDDHPVHLEFTAFSILFLLLLFPCKVGRAVLSSLVDSRDYHVWSAEYLLLSCRY